MALIDAFGTKQSRRAAQSMTENSILTTTPSGRPDAVEAAIIASIPAEDLAAASKSSATVETELRATKPIPPANMLATHPSDVYPMDTLVPNGLTTLHQLPVKEWKDAVVADLAILTVSRYVSRRVEAIAKWGTMNQLQILRYILILIEFSRCLKRTSLKDIKSLGPDSKKLPLRSELRTILSGQTSRGSAEIPSWANTLLPESVIDAIRGKFAPHGAYMSKTDITLLHTTICALSLHIPPMSSRDGSTITRGSNSPTELATDTADLRDDLLVQDSTIVQYFRELGCRVNKPREAEFAVWGIRGGKVEAAARRIARLSLPLEFPKSRHGGTGARRRR
jgi:DNA-directed RNA polymerase I subunit RPA49